MMLNELSGVIFDLDNTLVTSSLNNNEVKHLVDCPDERNIFDHVDSLPKALQSTARSMLMDYEMEDALTAKKLMGADELLTLLSTLTIPCAIVTRNSRKAALLKMANNHIHIPLLLSREDHKAKPDPDPLYYIAEHWQIAPEKILYVGDYLYDLQVAKNAKTLSCLVTNGKAPYYADFADVVVNDLIELKQAIAHMFNVPEHEILPFTG